MSTYTTFSGVLIRHAQNDWRWIDGTPEPRVRDSSPSEYYNFRIRSGKWVEVLLRDCHRERDILGWVLAGVESGQYQQSDSGDHRGPLLIDDDGARHMMIEPGEDPLRGNEPIVRRRAIPRVALVPVDDWDKWAADHPYGAQWDMANEQSIIERAKQYQEQARQ